MCIKHCKVTFFFYLFLLRPCQGFYKKVIRETSVMTNFIQIYFKKRQFNHDENQPIYLNLKISVSCLWLKLPSTVKPGHKI